MERIEKQGKFNPVIEAGAITHVFVGEKNPDPEAIFSLVKKTWENTPSAQICISPEFTVCEDCHQVSRGYDRD
jgi:ribonucleoside-triphosphate reductase